MGGETEVRQTARWAVVLLHWLWSKTDFFSFANKTLNGLPLLVVNKCQNNISLQRLVLLTVLRHMASDDKTRGLGTRVGDAAFKSAFYGSLLGLFVANWRENQAKSAAARAVAAKGPEAVKEYMWAARAEMGGALVRYGAFMGAAGGAYVTGKGLAEAYRGTDDPLNAALGAQAVAALFGVACTLRSAGST